MSRADMAKKCARFCQLTVTWWVSVGIAKSYAFFWPLQFWPRFPAYGCRRDPEAPRPGKAPPKHD